MKRKQFSNKTRAAIWVALSALPAFAQADGSNAVNPEATLPEVKVTAPDDGDTKFHKRKTSVASKVETDIRDIPQSISIVTQELMESQSAFSLRDALRNVSGLTIAAGEGSRTGDSITLRGYAANSDMYLDGVKDNGQYNRDTFFLEKVEVLKGASGIMFGRGSTGGVINQASKQADGVTRLDANVSYGSFNNQRVTMDLGTALNDVVSVRLNALWNDSDSFRDENFTKKHGFAPSIKFDFSDKTNLTLNYLYQRESGVFDYGVPMFQGKPANVATNKFYGFKDDGLQQYETKVATAIFKHEFTDDFSFKNTVRYGDYYRKYRTNLISAIGNDPSSSSYGTATYSQALRDSHQQNLYNQTDFVLQKPVLGLPNTLVFGVEYGEERFDFRSKNSTFNSGANQFSIFDAVFPNTIDGTRADDFTGVLANSRRVVAKTQAAYVQNELSVTEQWKLLAGVRYDDFRVDQTDYITKANNKYDTGNFAWSPRTGVVWQPTQAQSYYLSYGESFNPTAEQFALVEKQTTANLNAETNHNIELGAKLEVMPRLNFTAAVYRLVKDNARTTNTLTNEVTLDGKQRTNGLELGLAGEVASNWNVSVAYAYMDAKVLESNTTADSSVDSSKQDIPVQGKVVQNVPKNSGTIWTSYKFMDHWEVGGGVYAMSSRFTDNVNEVELPGYARLDGMLAYRQPKYDLQLNLYNLLDKKYYESGQVRSALPGIPLSGMLTLSIHY